MTVISPQSSIHGHSEMTETRLTWCLCKCKTPSDHLDRKALFIVFSTIRWCVRRAYFVTLRTVLVPLLLTSLIRYKPRVGSALSRWPLRL